MAEFETSKKFPVSAQRIYDAWVNGDEHAKFTGSPATSDAREGGDFSAWDGYIQGKHLTLEPGRRIVQAWRSTEFPTGAPDSRLEIDFEEANGETTVNLRHTEVPDSQGDALGKGWNDFYFVPLTKYFKPKAAPKKTVAKKTAPKKKAAVKKAAPKKVAAKKKSAPQKSAKKKAVKKSVKKSAPKKAAKKKPAKKKARAKK